MSEQLPAPVAKILLGRELERQRKNAGFTQEDVMAVLRCSQQKIGYMEHGGGIRTLELDALLDHYKASDLDRTYVQDLHAEANRRSKRGAFRSRFHQYLRLLVDMEPTCQNYYSYRTMVIPGLLQTEEYMRTLFRAWRPSPTQEQAEEDVRNRLARQHILNNPEQQFWFVLDEAALRRMAGNSDIANDQITRLIEIIDRPNIELQIVPFSTGYYMGQSHDYDIFGYKTTPSVDIVYLEQHDGGEYVNDAGRAAQYHTLWEQQKAAAVGPEQTRRFLRQLV